MYVYNEYWSAPKAILLYPSNKEERAELHAFKPITEDKNHICGLACIRFKEWNAE